jgi:hypothetical protein
MKGISTVLTDLVPKFHAFKAKVFSSMQATIFSTVCYFVLKYEGWNFNSGNYLFTTDTK